MPYNLKMFPWIMWFTYFFYLEVQITTDASHSKQLISILVHLSVEVILNLMIDIGARVGFMISVYKNMIFVYCTSNYWVHDLWIRDLSCLILCTGSFCTRKWVVYCVWVLFVLLLCVWKGHGQDFIFLILLFTML